MEDKIKYYLNESLFGHKDLSDYNEASKGAHKSLTDQGYKHTGSVRETGGAKTHTYQKDNHKIMVTANKHTNIIERWEHHVDNKPVAKGLGCSSLQKHMSNK